MNPIAADPPRVVDRSRSPLSLQAAAGLIGVALVGAALAANQQWLDRHFLPSFFVPRLWYVRIETGVRLAIAACGLGLAFVGRARVGRLVARGPRTTLHVVLAAVLGLVASEFVLRNTRLRPTEWLSPEEEPRREPDARLGWVLSPARTGSSRIGGRMVEYTIDAAGCRVRDAAEPVDSARPSIVFVGESVMFGEGLTWDESIPARVGAMLSTQSANLAVHGYSNDQAYLKLETELPRFRKPVAVVSLFMTELFGRNLDDDRPHLAPALVWKPAVQKSRLMSLAVLLVPFRSDRTVDQGVQVTREVMQATVNLARARGATPLIVIPQFGREDPSAASLRRRVVDDTIPSLVVQLDADWRLPWDRHPNANAAQAIAAAIAARLPQL